MTKINWGNISLSRCGKTAFSDLAEKCLELEKENKILKLTYAKCRDCKHANEYVPDYAYPYIIPKCELGIKKIDFDSNACEDFELIGRKGR